jgi:hypothetical protein
MTRKDYEAIAGALAGVQSMTGDPPGWEFTLTVRRIGDVLQADNRRFDRERFEAACNVNSSPPDDEASVREQETTPEIPRFGGRTVSSDWL